MNNIIKRKNQKTRRVLEEIHGPATSFTPILEGLSSAILYKLLIHKNIPGRSKIRTKKNRVQTLAPLINLDDLRTFGISIPAPQPEKPFWTFTNEGAGIRKEEPVIGIDMHRDTMVWAIANPNGIVGEGMFPNTEKGHQLLIDLCRSSQISMAVMESTAELWLPAYWALHDSKISTLVANPKQTKDTQGKKTDKLDARRLALALRDGRLNPSIVCNREQFALRKTMRHLLKTTQMATGTKNRLHQIFKKATDSKTIKTYLKSDRGMYILSHLPECESMQKLQELVVDAFSKRKGKVEHEQGLRENIQELWIFYKNLVKNRDLSRFTILMGQLLEFKANVIHLRREGLIYAKNHPKFLKNLKLLLTIPGVDLDTAIPILAEIVDVRFFKSAPALSKWAGLTPAVKQSGHRKRRNGRLYKAGNKYLRRACWLISQYEYLKVSKEGHPIGKFVQRMITQRGLIRRSGITAGARKVMCLIYHLLHNQTPYDPPNAEEDEKSRILCQTERKRRRLDRILNSLPDKEVIPSFLIRVKSSFARYQVELNEFQVLCENVLGIEVSGME